MKIVPTGYYPAGHGSPTPWGRADHVDAVGPDGIKRYSTPSHGGYFVPKKLLHLIPARYRAYARKWSGSEQWYEEDCAWACVCASFPQFFSEEDWEHARQTLSRWVEGEEGLP